MSSGGPFRLSGHGPTLGDRDAAIRPPPPPSTIDLEQELDRYRRELTGYCYRMLGSGSEAEDAVQETFIRAWKAYDRFEGRSSLRSWLYRIATNVCVDMHRGPQRRARPMDLGPSSTVATAQLRVQAENTFVLPMADGRVIDTAGDPPSWRPAASRSGWPSSPPSSTCPPASGPC